MTGERDQIKDLDEQATEHLNFLCGLGFSISELVVTKEPKDGRWVKCVGEGSPKPHGSYCYISRVNVLDSEGLGMVTVAKRHGETFVHKTLPRLEKEHSSSLSPPSRSYLVTDDSSQPPQTTEDLKRLQFIWGKASPTGRSLYLERKGLRPVEGLRFSSYKSNSLVMPLRDEHRVLRGLQFIDDDGSKRITGRLKGNAFRVGRPQPGGSVALCEGITTAICLHDLTGLMVLAAISCCNLTPVAQAVRKALPEVEIIICGDDDRHLRVNEGVRTATQAAALVGGIVAVPDFGGAPAEKWLTDWLDLATLRGRPAALEQLRRFLI